MTTKTKEIVGYACIVIPVLAALIFFLIVAFEGTVAALIATVWIVTIMYGAYLLEEAAKEKKKLRKRKK